MIKISGQSTVEYILLVTAVIAVIIAVTGPAGLFHTRLQDAIETTTDGMGDMAHRLMGVTNPTPTPAPTPAPTPNPDPDSNPD